MRILLIIVFLIHSLCIFGQNFHTSFSDYYFMQPSDFAIIDDGYVISINYGFSYSMNKYSLLIKTDINGHRTHKLDLNNKDVFINGVTTISSKLLLAYGVINKDELDYPIAYLVLINNELEIVKEFEFEATKIAAHMQHIRASINNKGNIICCINNDYNADFTRQGGYLLALSQELELLNSNYFSLKDNIEGLNLVDDIMPFNNSDTSLVIIEIRKAYLVDNLANIIDSVDDFLLYEDGYRIGRTLASSMINDNIYVGGSGGYSELAVVKFDRNMNRLKTCYFGDSNSIDDINPHTGYTNTLTANSNYLYTVILSDWDYHSVYYTTDNYMTVRKIDTALNLVWEKKYSANGWGFFPFSIRATPDGGFGLLATRNHYETMGDRVEAYFIKADSLGNFDTTLVVAIKELESSIKVFPNPGSNFLTIENNNSSEYVFTLYSIAGKKVLSKQVNAAQTTIKTQYLPTGMYVYELRKNGMVFNRGKWVKQ